MGGAPEGFQQTLGVFLLLHEDNVNKIHSLKKITTLLAKVCMI